MKRIACLWFPQWPLQRHFRYKPEHRRQPVILFGESSRHGEVVVQATPVVHQAGIVPSMPLADAKALLGKTEVHIEHIQPEADLRELRTIALDCQQFSPIVGVDVIAPPESLLFDITGCSHLFGSERKLCRKILGCVGSRGYVSRLAVADSVGMAWAVAHYGMKHNNRYRIINDADANDLPVEALRLSGNVASQLQEFDLFKVGQVLALPHESLKPRFGDELPHRLAQLFAEIDEPIVPEVLQEPVIATESLEYGTTDQRLLEIVIKRLLTKLIERLLTLQHGVLRLQITFSGLEVTTQHFSIGTIRPNIDAHELWRLMELKLESLRLPGEIDCVILYATETAPLRYDQRGLIDDGSRQAERELESLINCLSNRLGPEAVLQAELTEDVQPEFSVEYRPMIQAEAQQVSTTWRTFPNRPATLFNEPIAVRVNSVVPYGPPLRFWWNREEHIANIVWGPERIETGWWREMPIQRDYYRFETTDFRRFWLFRRRGIFDWFLHGCFD